MGKERSEDDIQKQKDTIAANGGVWNKGLTGIYSEESLKKMSDNHPNKGKELSQDLIDQREKTKREKSDEEKALTKQRQIDAQKGRPKNPLSIAKRMRTNQIKRVMRIAEKI